MGAAQKMSNLFYKSHIFRGAVMLSFVLLR